LFPVGGFGVFRAEECDVLLAQLGTVATVEALSQQLRQDHFDRGSVRVAGTHGIVGYDAIGDGGNVPKDFLQLTLGNGWHLHP